MHLLSPSKYKKYTTTIVCILAILACVGFIGLSSILNLNLLEFSFLIGTSLFLQIDSSLVVKISDQIIIRTQQLTKFVSRIGIQIIVRNKIAVLSSVPYVTNMVERSVKNTHLVVVSILSSIKWLILLIVFIYNLAVPAHSNEFFTINFKPEETPNVTYYVSGTNQTYATKYATMRYSSNPVNVGSWGLLNGVFTWDYVSKGTGVQEIPYGTWYFKRADNKCYSGASHHCPEIRFEPNSTNINAINLGDTMTAQVYYYLGSLPYKYTNLHYVRTNMLFDWRSTSTGEDSNRTNNSDTFSEQYADLKVSVPNESDFSLKLKLSDGTNQPTEHVLTKSEKRSDWAGQEWYYESPYGEWFVRSLADCDSEYYMGFKCSTIFFKPNRTELNRVYGRNITMNLLATTIVAGTTTTESIQYDFIGHPSTSFEFENEGSETIVTGNLLTFDDIKGTATIFKLKESAFTFDAVERLNQSSQSFEQEVGSSESVSDFMASPIGVNFKYGKWYVEDNFSGVEDPHDDLFHSGDLKFLFRPDTTEINSILNTDESIIYTLNFHIHAEDDTTQKITTTSIIVTIDRSSVKPILSITSKTNSVVEGQTATFTITSNVNPMQPFYVSYIPTNTSGDFLNTATFPSGLPQFENLTFSQAEGSEDWTDEIEIDLRETDGVDTEDGSITVTLNTTSDYAFYFAAAEPDNSITINVKDAEYPTLNFAESSYTVTETDADKNMQLTLTISESIGDTIRVSYTIVNESAIGGVDFVDIANGSVTILPNTTSIPIIIQINGDDVSEGDETFKVIISDPPTNAYFSRGISELEATVNIYDDEPILLSAATTNFNVPEDVVDGNFVIDIQLTSAVAHTNSVKTSVSYVTTVSSGTATLGEDFMSPVINRRTINRNSITDSQLIPILNDIDNEGNETFTVTISKLVGASFASGGTELTIDVTIVDNENPELSLAEDSYSITERDTETNVELTFNLSGPIENPVEISYEIIENTATADDDFTNISNGTATVTPNTTSVSISIQIKGDTRNEGNETFMLKVATPPTNAVFADRNSELVATITIIDDEVPTLFVDNSTLSVSEVQEQRILDLYFPDQLVMML